MAKSYLPLRPNKGNDYGELSEEEMDCLTWYVITGKDKLACYLTFVRPDMRRAQKQNAEKWSNQFYAVADVRNYIKDYTDTLNEFLNPKVERRELTAEDREKRKESAIQAFTDNVIDSVENSEKTTDVETLTGQANLLNKVGLLKDAEEKTESPRRYIPELCRAQCRYRLFMETAIEKGDIIDECQYCRALEIAKEHGFVYDPTKLLNIPQDSKE